MAIKIILWFLVGFLLGRLIGLMAHLRDLHEIKVLIDEFDEWLNQNILNSKSEEENKEHDT